MPQGHFTAPAHKIPNVGIGKWKVRNCIRVFFPDLYSADRTGCELTPNELKQFYEDGVRPALLHLLGDRGHILPTTYESEMFRARGEDGRISFASHMFPDWGIRSFGDVLRETLVDNQVFWARNLVFFHEIQGVKNTSYHNLESIDAALDQFLQQNSLPPSLIHEDDFYIDVAIEISSDLGESLAWRTDSHHEVIQELTGVNDRTAQRLTKHGSSRYHRDNLSHMSALSGCRIETGKNGRGWFDTQYVQLYHTDKTLTARAEGNKVAKTVSLPNLLRGKAEDWFDKMYRLYLTSQTSPSHARAEMRVSISNAMHALSNIDLERLSTCLVAIPTTYFW